MKEPTDPAAVFPNPRRRPMSLDWISDDLIRDTQKVWAKVTGKPVSTDDAIEMLTNVRRLAEVLMDAKRNTGKAEQELADRPQ